ncbi:alpha/beta hydrolase [Membranihabitans maritimus]|uniref:alpha/beta hydrolase n=1 Tax=Membranihabitans maritimus TaxID=2904244 RepID=UPI001F1BC9B9|nr:alpha/beta hydrolase [Membranihabitans maritimus]
MHWKLRLFLYFLHRAESSIPESIQDYRNTLNSNWKKYRRILDGKLVAVDQTKDITILNRDSVPLRVREYKMNRPSSQIIFYLHGGGWVGRSIDTYDNVCRRMCKNTNSTVYSIGYRLSPETKFPGAINDSIDTIEYIFTKYIKTNTDQKQVVLCGDSAGGNMAIGVLKYFEKNPTITFDKLIVKYPPMKADLDQLSVKKFGRGYIIEKQDIEWMRDQYLPSAIDREDPLVSPLNYKDYSFLPPSSLVITSGYDPLQDQGIIFKNNLKKHKIQYRHIHYEDLPHGFYLLNGLSPEISKAYRDLYNFIQE